MRRDRPRRPRPARLTPTRHHSYHRSGRRCRRRRRVAAAVQDPRTYPQRMHDALHDTCQRLLASGTLPEHSGVPSVLVITMTAAQFTTGTGTATTGHGQPRHRHAEPGRPGRDHPRRPRPHRRCHRLRPDATPRHHAATPNARCPRRRLLLWWQPFRDAAGHLAFPSLLLMCLGAVATVVDRRGPHTPAQHHPPPRTIHPPRRRLTRCWSHQGAVDAPRTGRLLAIRL